MTLIPRLHANDWYEGFNISGENLLKDATNRLMGIVKIRQYRIRSDICEIPKPFDALNMTCAPEYKGKYLGGYPEILRSGRMKYVWELEKRSKMKAIVNIYVGKFHICFFKSCVCYVTISLGEIAWYYGSGFIAKLGRNEHNSIYVLNYLKENNWIDEHTRMVVLKFWTYNVNDNVFNSVRIGFEKSATGYFTNSFAVSYKEWHILNQYEPGRTRYCIIFSLILDFHHKTICKHLQTKNFQFHHNRFILSCLFGLHLHHIQEIFHFRFQKILQLLELFRLNHNCYYNNYDHTLHTQMVFSFGFNGGNSYVTRQ